MTHTYSPAAFDALDPLDIDSLYSDDEIAVRDSVRGFCARAHHAARRGVVRGR